MDDAQALAGLRVKPLEWRQGGLGIWNAASMGLGYFVDGTHWWVTGYLSNESAVICADEEAGKAAAQAHYEARVMSAIDRLAAPEGVGLTRWSVLANMDHQYGGTCIEPVENPEGEWVRHEDAAAAIAALEQCIAGAEKECAQLERVVDARGVRAVKAEAERNALKAALAPLTEIAQDAPAEIARRLIAVSQAVDAALSKTQGGE